MSSNLSGDATASGGSSFSQPCILETVVDRLKMVVIWQLDWGLSKFETDR
ncbi:MAG: hypothetical protein V7L25_18040 [Nostoc sp.]